MAALATLILTLHLIWLGSVIFGAFFTRGRPIWTTVHILALVWGIVVEVGPWPCPLTLAEQYFEGRAGLHAYSGSFLLHYVDALVYPNLPYWLITTFGVAVCSINLAIYLWRFHAWLRKRWLARLASN